MQSKNNKFALTITGLLCLLTLALTGCSTTTGGVSPLAARHFTAAAVSKSVDGNPDLKRQLSAVQPIVCAVTTRQTLTPQDILDAVATVSDADSADAYAAVNLVMAIYITAMGDPAATNAPAWKPYAQAVWCDGFRDGLALPASRSRNAPPVAYDWPMLKVK